MEIKTLRSNHMSKMSGVKKSKKGKKMVENFEAKPRAEVKEVPKLVPKTIESMREKDDTMVVLRKDQDGNTEKIDDEETELDIANDEFEEYFNKSYVPKVLITSCDNPHSRTIAFMKELSRIIPNSEPKWRRRASLKNTIKNCSKHGFTDIVVVNEDNRMPNGMLISHLPEGPTASFRLSNVKVAKDLKKDFKQIGAQRPEVILNNFSTRLGHTVSRMLASLFHYEPQFRGKRCVTFHNQRDYIFFRHHMYDIKSAEKVKLREMGPRFTLKLRSLQKGTFDSKLGEYEWIIQGRRHDMETSRRRFFL